MRWTTGCVWAVLAAACSAAWAPPARAHGGVFIEDGNPSNPGNRGLAPPTSGSAPVTAGDTPLPPSTTSRPAWEAGDWTLWWRLNAAAFLPDRNHSGRRAAETASSGLFQVGEALTGNSSEWDGRFERGAIEQAQPFLIELLDPKRDTDPETVGTALIALGRIARDPGCIDLLARHALDREATEEVRESAVLALGLLRRTQASRRLPPSDLCRVRTFLLDLFDDDDAPVRVRSFAAFSLGMLGDQPFGDEPMEQDGRRITYELWSRLRARYASAELPIALFTALGMQPTEGVPSGVLDGLKDIAAGRPVWRRPWDGFERSHALTALARLGGATALPTLFQVLSAPSGHLAVRGAAQIALARLAPLLSPGQRVETVRLLLKTAPRESHWLVEGLGFVAMGALIAAAAAEGSDRLLVDTGVDRFLFREAMEGSTMTRPFAALGLGVAVHGMEPVTRSLAVFQIETARTLLRGLEFGHGSDTVLGAYAVALGMTGAQTARPLLLDTLKNVNRAASLRGHAALALGQIGHATPDDLKCLTKAMEERLSSFVHVQAASALALLGAPDVRDSLLKQLLDKHSRGALASVAAAVGRFGDPTTASALIAMAKKDTDFPAIRTMSVAALGLIFDPEPRPSRVRFTTNANYPARTSSLSQIFDIL